MKPVQSHGVWECAKKQVGKGYFIIVYACASESVREGVCSRNASEISAWMRVRELEKESEKEDTARERLGQKDDRDKMGQMQMINFDTSMRWVLG